MHILSFAYFLIKTHLLNSLSDIDELSMGKSNQLVKNLIILSTFCAFHRKLKIRSNYAEFSSYSSFHFCGIWYLPYFCIIFDFCSRRCSADRNWRGKKCRRTAFPLSFHLLLLLLFYDLISFQNIQLRFNGWKVTGIAALTIQPSACYANWQLLVVEQQKKMWNAHKRKKIVKIQGNSLPHMIQVKEENWRIQEVADRNPLCIPTSALEYNRTYKLNMSSN